MEFAVCLQLVADKVGHRGDVVADVPADVNANRLAGVRGRRRRRKELVARMVRVKVKLVTQSVVRVATESVGLLEAASELLLVIAAARVLWRRVAAPVVVAAVGEDDRRGVEK